MNFIALELTVFIKIVITMSFLKATFNGNSNVYTYVITTSFETCSKTIFSKFSELYQSEFLSDEVRGQLSVG